MLNMAVDVGFGRVKALGDNGRTANCRGFLKFGRRCWR